MTSTEAPSVRTLLTREGLADPYAIHERFRQLQRDGHDIGRVVVAYDEVTALLANRALSSDRVAGILGSVDHDVLDRCPLVERTLGGIIAFRDPPGHSRVRALLAKTFTPRMVRGQTEVIRSLTDHLLDPLVERGEADLHRELTHPLPAMVVAAMLGVPKADWDRFMAWALDIVFIVGAGSPSAELIERANDHFSEMRAYLGWLLGERRSRPTDDLLSAMLAASEDDDRLSEDEIFSNALFLMTAGHETATNMLSNGLLALLRHPEQRRRLDRDPSLIESAGEEMLRYESPVQMTPRLVLEDTVLAGRSVRAGTALLLFLGAANRDPSRFDEPHRFDIGRRDNRHVAFGFGTHFCLGAALARLELVTVIPRVLHRLPGMELGPDELEWQATIDFRGPLSLPVEWEPSSLAG